MQIIIVRFIYALIIVNKVLIILRKPRSLMPRYNRSLLVQSSPKYYNILLNFVSHTYSDLIEFSNCKVKEHF